VVKSLKQGKVVAQKRRRLIKKDGQDVGQEKSNNSLYLVIRQVGYLLVILTICAYYNDGRKPLPFMNLNVHTVIASYL